ncbi:MAG: hypothetical protein QM808_09745 [Steroidobacteraceae bacterium]
MDAASTLVMPGADPAYGKAHPTRLSKKPKHAATMRNIKGTYMKKSSLILIPYFLAGCTAQTYRVDLSPPSRTATNLVVKDERLSKDIFITTTTALNSTYVYYFSLTPSMEESLSRYIQSRTQESIQVSIQRLELRSKIGFGVPNQSTCEIESIFKINNNERSVRTFAENKDDMSSRVQSVGKAILNPCLSQHGRDIASKIEAQMP